MASTVWDSLTCANLFVAFAAVTGFAEKKHGRLSADYVFVVEVFWSDGRTTYVKRTYKDFLRFHKLLGFHFRTKSTSNGEKLCVPRLEGKHWYKKYTRNLAEYRELELHHFVKELLKVSPDVASENAVIEFFEQRPTDPVPCPKEDKRFEPPPRLSGGTRCNRPKVNTQQTVLANGREHTRSEANHESQVLSNEPERTQTEAKNESQVIFNETERTESESKNESHVPESHSPSSETEHIEAENNIESNILLDETERIQSDDNHETNILLDETEHIQSEAVNDESQGLSTETEPSHKVAIQNQIMAYDTVE